MTEQALTALKGSIEHWRRLYTGKRLRDEWIGPLSCALCRQFNALSFPKQNGPESGCDGCPVKERTGKDYCVDTPYAACDKYLADHSGTDADEAMNRGEFQDLALLELEFLESLLPKEEHVTTTNEVQQPNSGGPE
mgnify:CR=1 FL=1